MHRRVHARYVSRLRSTSRLTTTRQFQRRWLSGSNPHSDMRTGTDKSASVYECVRARPLTEHYPELLQALKKLVEPTTRGDPESPLRWTCKSTRHWAGELQRQGYRIGERKVADLLHRMRYSLQANAKTIEGSDHPDRNAQCEYINAQAKKFLRQNVPVISVDTKKKELVGNYSKAGQEWRPQGEPEETLLHDFPDEELGKAIPYGVYDVGQNQGWVSVGIDHDTAEFAMDSILSWWKHMGCKTYPQATELLIMADAGGSNSSRSRLWKMGFLLWAERFAISRAPSCYDSKRTRPPCDCSIEIAFESKETNSSAPSHSPS